VSHHGSAKAAAWLEEKTSEPRGSRGTHARLFPPLAAAPSLWHTHVGFIQWVETAAESSALAKKSGRVSTWSEFFDRELPEDLQNNVLHSSKFSNEGVSDVFCSLPPISSRRVEK